MALAWTVCARSCPRCARDVPAMCLERARVEAKQRADQYGVDVTITGIGPETGFKEIVRPML